MELKRSHKKITEKELKEFEGNHGVTFPDSFKDFYLEWNGGSPSHRYFKGYRIAGFMPIKYHDRTKNNTHTIEWFVDLLRDVGRLPKDYIPFAGDGGGWEYAINLSSENYGSIYVLPNGTGDNSPVFLTEDFESFLNNLSIENDY